MATKRENFVRRIVQQRSALAQRKNAPLLERQQFLQELNYQICAALAHTMYRAKMLTKREYRWLVRYCLRKYRPALGGLFAAVDEEVNARENS